MKQPSLPIPPPRPKPAVEPFDFERDGTPPVPSDKPIPEWLRLPTDPT